MALEEVYSMEEVAKWLKATIEAVENEIKLGRLKAFRFGDEWRIPESSLRQIMEASAHVKEGPLFSPDISLHPVPDFDYKWPMAIEHYEKALAGEMSFGGKVVSLKIGECSRDTYGRTRKRIIVFLDDYPVSEFVETDNPREHYFTLLPGNPDPRKHLRPGDIIDPEWREYTMRELKDVIVGPGAGDSLGIVLSQNDYERMADFAWQKAHKKWGWP